ncbi:PTS sugar transporter subunit IIA [Hungatella hominis]|uniref:PTS sugar transporter n=1 Tax=Hungatella hominis TaxID=2763050 RepID=A0ABR7HFY5_9FIRM|nr:PTS sugar transporter [Hungatella hominis]MBC5712113.1 PTS sugar transporter [Hungatella hominis]
MRHIIVATHGKFAEGILDSVRLIMGEHKEVQPFCAFVEQGVNLNDQVDALLSSIPETDEILVAADLMGGSVCNEFIRRLDRPGLHIVAGLNLAMLLEMIANVDLPIDDVIRSAVELSRESIVFCNPLAVGTPVECDSF